MPINGGRAHPAVRIESCGNGFSGKGKYMIDLRYTALREKVSTPNGLMRLRIQSPKMRRTSRESLGHVTRCSISVHALICFIP